MLLYTFVHNLLNVLVQTANKMGLRKICQRNIETGERRSKHVIRIAHLLKTIF
jgi:hypothetical protein